MIKLVVFDMMGTTIHDGDSVNIAFQQTLFSRGIEIHPSIVNSVMGLPKPDAIRILLKGAGRPILDHDVESIHDDFTNRMKHFYANDPSVREIDGAEHVFEELRKAKIKVALNTGFFRPISDTLLKRLTWTVPEVIDAEITSDDVPRGRPYPDMIQNLMNRFDISDPMYVAKVGDTRADMEEGVNVGCRFVIGVTSGSYTKEQLSQYPHTHIVPSITSVPEIIFAS